MGTTTDIFKGSPFWQEIRTGLFVIQDYDWKQTLTKLPELINVNKIVTGLQTHEQILASHFFGRSIVKGLPIEARPNEQTLAEGLPPEDHYNVEALFLQWLYQFYILEGICSTFQQTPLGEFPSSLLDMIDDILHFLVFIAAVMWLLEEGVIKGAPTRAGMPELLPLVEFKLKKITETLLSKTADYGESYRRHGLQGSIPRLWDKLARFAQLSALGRTANYEPKADAVKDLLGYSVIAWSLVREIHVAETSKTIKINGDEISILNESVDYDDLVEHVYGVEHRGTLVPTVVYHKKSGEAHSIRRGQSVTAEDGMRFEVVMTNCA